MNPYQLRGQPVAKRAFEVALVGNLRVALIGPLGTSKTTIREAFPGVESDECESCPCGYYLDAAVECTCNERLIYRWFRRMARWASGFDIVLESCRVTTRDMLSQQKPDKQEDVHMWARVQAARKFGIKHTSTELNDDAAFRTMEMACRRLSLTTGQYISILNTARAIANLDGSDLLKAKHVAEAVQYRGDATIFRLDKLVYEEKAKKKKGTL